MTTFDAWLKEEPFTLALSSGFFGFFAHAGFVSALFQAGHRPKALSGASAGALVGGFLAAGVEPSDIEKELIAIDRRDFWDPALGFGLLRGRAFDRLLRRLIGQRRVETCSIPIKISTFDVLRRRTHIVEEGDLATAMRASCAFPGLFQPVRMDGRHYLDGGILDRPALAGIPLGARVVHHHLASKSPWRAALPETVAPPVRDNQLTVMMRGLPRSGPLSLEKGRIAMRMARERAERALSERTEGHILDVA